MNPDADPASPGVKPGPVPPLDPLTRRVSLAGAAIYLAAAGLIFYLASDPKLSDVVWSRLLLVFNGVASVGFACFGVLLGTTVQNAKIAQAKAESTKKSQAMNDALEVLAGIKANQADEHAFMRRDGRSVPADVASSEMAQTASRILRAGLM